SKDSTGKVHITLVNIDPKNKYTINTALMGVKFSSVTGQILTSQKLTDVNTFNDPLRVKNIPFNGAKKQNDQLVVEVPAQSIVMLELK
ncbi:MAG: alpha-N-arabinofuranosidase, partial [Chitinophagaceae bacterium]